MVVNRPEDIIFRTEDPSSDIVIADVHVGRLYFLTGNMSHMPQIPFSTKHPDSTRELLTSVAGSLGHLAQEVLNQNEHGNPVDLWSVGLSYLLSLLTSHGAA